MLKLPELVGSELRLRPNALMMPVVIVPTSPKGLPIAMARAPTLTSFMLPCSAGTRSTSEGSTLITARSLPGSVPTTCAGTSTPSAKVTLS